MDTMRHEELVIRVDWDEKIMLDFVTPNSDVFITLDVETARKLANSLNNMAAECAAWEIEQDKRR